MKQAKVAITGSSGFIGSHLVSRLKNDPNIEIVEFDEEIHSLENFNSLESLLSGADFVFHLAGVADPKLDLDELEKVNCVGTEGILEGMLSFCPKALLIFSSTFGVYRPPEKGEVVDENFPVDPRNNYGKSKLKAEEMVKKYHQGKQLKAVILRFANVYGPGMEPYKHSVIATWFDQFKQKRSITVTGDDSATRDFLYIDDLVDALLAVLENNKKLKFSTVNLCSGVEVSLKSLLKEMVQVTGIKADISFNNQDTNSMGFWKGDNTLASKLLNWHPQVSLLEGLKVTWESIR